MKTTRRDRCETVQHWFHKDPTDSHYYDLVLNMSRLSVGEAADLIVQALRQIGGTPCAAAQARRLPFNVTGPVCSFHKQDRPAQPRRPFLKFRCEPRSPWASKLLHLEAPAAPDGTAWFTRNGAARKPFRSRFWTVGSFKQKASEVMATKSAIAEKLTPVQPGTGEIGGPVTGDLTRRAGPSGRWRRGFACGPTKSGRRTDGPHGDGVNFWLEAERKLSQTR